MTINISLIESFGSDLTVANAARVTMGVEHKELNERDEKLIKFLARERHVSPFRHPQVSFRCTAPIAIARQLGKHQVGFTWNEMSRRYKDGDVDCFVPEVLFHRPEDLHKGSAEPFEGEADSRLKNAIAKFYEESVSFYNELLDSGLAPEQARFVLPQGMETNWYWTGSLYGWADLCRQRLSTHAQYEVRLFAHQIDEEMSKLFPISWEALKNANSS